MIDPDAPLEEHVLTEAQVQTALADLIDLPASANYEIVPGWWWLSFAGADGFLGLNIICANSFVDALERSHRLGINPGGSVQGFLIPYEHRPPESYWHRLLTAEEAYQIGGQEPEA